MGNKEILEEINKKIEIVKGIINSKRAEEIYKIFLDIEKLIEIFQPENDIQKRIIKNRISDFNNLKISYNNPEKEKPIKNGKENKYYGKVESINFVDCQKWIEKNKDNWKSKINDIRTFTDKFPFKDNSIDGLSINEYVIGTFQYTFCWYLERGTPGLAGQRSSLDYYLYWSSIDQSFAIREGVNRELISTDKAEKVFDVLKANMENMLNLVKTDKIDSIDEKRHALELPKAQILQKILFLYFPDKFIGYYSSAYVSKIAAMVGINVNADVYQTNHAIAQKVAEKITNPELSPIDKNVAFTAYLYDVRGEYIRKAVEEST